MNAEAVSKQPVEPKDSSLPNEKKKKKAATATAAMVTVAPVPRSSSTQEDSTTSDDDSSSSSSLDSSDSWNLVADNANGGRDRNRETPPKDEKSEPSTSPQLAHQFTQLKVHSETASMETDNSKTESLPKGVNESKQSYEAAEALARSLQMVLNCEKTMGLDGVFVGAALQRDPTNAAKFLVACDNGDTAELLEVGKIATSKIRSEPELLLDENATSSLALLSPKRVEELLRDDEMQATEFTMFRILHKWLKCASGSNLANEATAAILHKKAADMMKHIALEEIPPSALAMEVRTSGLATEAQLLRAYFAHFDQTTRAQAIWTNRQLPKSGGEVKRSERIKLDELGILAGHASDDPEGGWICDTVCIGEGMAQGKKYKWSFFVKECNSNGNRDIYLGIASGAVYPTTSLGSSKNAMALSNDGVWFDRGISYTDGKARSRSFKKGSTVSFELDLDDYPRDELRVSVDGRPWKNLSYIYDRHSTYRPAGSAASVRGGGAVEFLGFD